MNELREDLITIFTPMYNRAHLLGRLFDSLKRQTCQKFEWIAIDDGSTDNTLDTLHELRRGGGGKFPITIMHTENGGKHKAINRAVQEAHGEYFTILDSDDYLLHDAVENIFSWIKNIKQEPDYKYFAGVSGCKLHEDGSIIGASGNGEAYIDATVLETGKYNLYGDKAEVYKTSIMKNFPFVEFEGENFLVEGTVWLLIATAGYKLRYFPVGVQVCEYLPDGLSHNGTTARKRSFDGYTYETRLSLRLCDDNAKQKFMNISHYGLMAKEKGFSFREAAKRIGVNYFTMCFSLLLYTIYQPLKIFIKKGRRK